MSTTKYRYTVTITFETTDAVPRAKIGRYCRDAINYGGSELSPTDPLYDIKNIRVPRVATEKLQPNRNS
jgi:hypothetical protein